MVTRKSSGQQTGFCVLTLNTLITKLYFFPVAAYRTMLRERVSGKSRACDANSGGGGVDGSDVQHLE